MIKSVINRRVPYYEVDRMGYLFYGYYPLLYEAGRTELLREIGMPNSKLEEEGFLLPAISLEVKYKQPIHYDELIRVETIVDEVPLVRLTFNFELFNNRRLVNKGASQFCFVDAQSRQPLKAPKMLIEAFEKRL